MYTPKTSDEAVKKATGKDWGSWFTILDKAGAKKMQHKDIVVWVFEHHLGKGKPESNVATSEGWWSQMVTVEYERSRGIRKVNQNVSGFLVGIHKTLTMSPQQFEKAWQQILRNKAVAGKKLERLPSKTKRPMIRYSAKEGGLVVTYEKQPSGKLCVMVEAIKLPNEVAVERERAFWKKILAGIDSFS